MTWQWIRKRSLTFKFEAFFVLSTILPVLIVGWFLFSSLQQTFNEKKDTLLQTTTRFLEDSIRDNYHELELSAHQVIDLQLREAYSRALQTGQYQPITHLLQTYLQANQLDVVYLFDTNGHVLTSLGSQEPFSMQELNNLVKRAIAKKRAVNGFKRFKPSDEEHFYITYTQAYPIILNNQPEGILLIGRSIRNDAYLKELAQERSDFLLRIITKTESGYELEYTSQKIVGQYLTHSLEKQLRNAGTRSQLFTTLHNQFMENINGRDYTTNIISLANQPGKPLSFLLISFSHQRLDDLKTQTLLFTSLGIITLLALILAMGIWVQKRFVNPVNQLRLVAQDVIAGNLSSRVPYFVQQNEVTQTLELFNQMLDELEENQSKRNTFIATLTHDMKTPLLAQQKVLDIFLQEFQMGDRVALTELAEGMLKNNESMLQMITMLLEAEKYQEGKMVLNYEKIDLYQMAQECLQALQPLATEKRITLSSSIPDTFPEFQADSQQLKRVLTNLITNAIENIPEGGKVTLLGKANDKTVQIQVCDDGPGLDPGLETTLFDKYVSGSKTAQKIGSGLGLYICKLIITHHGGKISVAGNPEGRGSCFQVELPVTRTLS